MRIENGKLIIEKFDEFIMETEDGKSQYLVQGKMHGSQVDEQTIRIESMKDSCMWIEYKCMGYDFLIYFFMVQWEDIDHKFKRIQIDFLPALLIWVWKLPVAESLLWMQVDPPFW